MLLWVLLALMTGAAVLSVLWPLSRHVAPALEPQTDVAFYRRQLAEIDRDRERGVIGGPEAEAAKIESSRRLLRAASEAEPETDITSEPALRRRRAASALALSVVPIIGLALYGGLGSPQLPSRQAAAQPQADLGSGAAAPDIATALARIEDHLAAHPDDGRGWDIVAPIYLRGGRFEDAARAYANARRLDGSTPERLLGHGEALVSAGQGIVSAEARAIFQGVLALDRSSPPARYYLALAAEQEGDRDGAEAGYRSLIADAPPGAPWLTLVERRLAAISGQPEPAVPQAQAPVPPEIAAMVSGLDERLRAGGGSEAEWARLIRSFVVLGRRDDALDRVARARSVLAGDPDALARLDDLARSLGLSPEVAGR